ncbi:hypothetical protein [Parafannyhessea umbonata]|uniref:Uncharacterized protein n=1 Tax=Parafannyhessea umbonata TaxID=604330 RepID=A0A1H1L3Q3_9ACTN|nr:hypothetical protein [Parafannyhessea umbonata]SDR69017.1 hypothetical protein SAMN04489857_0663 [Parafannyhessea umbonata]
MSDKQARLMERAPNTLNGGTFEVWNIGAGCGIYVDFNPCPTDTKVPETMAFSIDFRRNRLENWGGLGVWYEDATGGKAIRELGYEPIEDGSSDGKGQD